MTPLKSYLIATSLFVFVEAHASAKTDVVCTIMLDVPKEARASSLDNCLAALAPEDVNFVSLVIEKKVTRRLSPALRQAEKWKTELQESLTHRFPETPVQVAIESRGELKDVARVRLVLKEKDTRVASLEPPPVTLQTSPVSNSKLSSKSSTGEQKTVALDVGTQTFHKEAFYRLAGVSLSYARPLYGLVSAAGKLSLATLQSDRTKDLFAPSLALGTETSTQPVRFALWARAGVLLTADRQWEWIAALEPAVGVVAGPVRLTASYHFGNALQGPIFSVGGVF